MYMLASGLVLIVLSILILMLAFPRVPNRRR
jgi:hypothetical protein